MADTGDALPRPRPDEYRLATRTPKVCPSVYRKGYERASRLNAEVAGRYIRETATSDEGADAVMDALAPCGTGEANRLIKACMEAPQGAGPPVLRDFFREAERTPAWFDPQALRPGYEAFHEQSDLFVPAFVVATLRNSSTLIAKSFYASGRVMGSSGLRRIRQNTRHFIEIMLPHALDRYNDGWKLSVRIRLVHARLRRLIRDTGMWDESVYGVPLSQAHMALASANFSATMLRYAEMLGASLNAEKRNGFMQAWRYASCLIGTPEHLLFEGDYDGTIEFGKIAHLCEPPPNDESRAIAKAVVEALPLIAREKESDWDRHDAFVDHTYRVARALLGDALADSLGFPPRRTAGLLAWMRMKRRTINASRKLGPGAAGHWRGDSFRFLLEASMLEDLGYRLPDHLDADKSTPW